MVSVKIVGGSATEDYREDAINDFRWQETVRLSLFELDTEYATAFQEWESKYFETEDYRLQVGNLKEALEQEENRAFLEISDELLGGKTKAERDGERKAIIGVDDKVKECQASLQHATGLLVQSEAGLNVLTEKLKNLSSRLNWRSRYLGLLSSLPRTPLKNG